jgi:hypothetical protein
MIRVTSRLPPVLGSALVLLVAVAGEASAQQPAPPPPPAGAAPPAAAAPAPPPMAAPPPPPAAAPPPPMAAPPPMPPPPPPPTAVVTPATPLPLPPEAPPPKPTPAESPLRVSGAVRVGVILQDPNNPKNMSEFHLDTSGYSNAAELRLGGDVTPFFSWTADFNALLDGGAAGTAVGGTTEGATFADLSIEDLIAQFKADDAFQIWMGRLLVPSDRSNFAGPFFMSPWDYPGFYIKGAAPIGPIEGPNGRNQGVTVWGNVGPESKFKYFAGIYGIDQGGPTSTQAGGSNAFYSARLSYSLQGSEPGYFGSSTWYGDKNIVTLSVGGQYQKDGSVDPLTPTKKKDTFVGIADILAEENVPGTGTFSFEGQLYGFNTGYNFGNGNGYYSPTTAFYTTVSYLTPENIGVGKFQPLVRWQQTVNPAWTIIDGALAYVMKAYDARLVLTYEHIDTGADGGKSNSLQFGVQLQK